MNPPTLHPIHIPEKGDHLIELLETLMHTKKLVLRETKTGNNLELRKTVPRKNQKQELQSNQKQMSQIKGTMKAMQ